MNFKTIEKKINKAVDKLTNSSDGFLKQLLNSLMGFVKRHKKLIFIVVLIYVVFVFLFGEETVKKQDDDDESCGW